VCSVIKSIDDGEAAFALSEQDNYLTYASPHNNIDALNQ